MPNEITVAAELRSTRGKNAAYRLRAAGQIPAVMYGAGGSSVPVAVSPKEVNKILHSKMGHNTVFHLAVNGGENTPVMLVDWSHDPVRDSLLHVDMLRIDMSKRMRVKVPVQLAGEAYGIKTEGGLMDIVNREIEIECLPTEIPEHLTVNVAELHLNQAIRAGDVPLGEGMILITAADAVVCHVVMVRDSVAEEAAAAAAAAEGAAAEAAAAAPAEPEVIKKGKKEEEGADEKKK
jgi:large subunit ribosomal protein L25